MGELKMEKKGDVELAKIIAEIDALKEEAAQVGRAPTPFSALKSRARPPPASSSPLSGFPLAGATLTLPPRVRPLESAARQTQRDHREDARAGEDLPFGAFAARSGRGSPIARARALPSVDLLELALRADPRSSSSRHLPPPR
jgi:hypothetical protein